MYWMACAFAITTSKLALLFMVFHAWSFLEFSVIFLDVARMVNDSQPIRSSCAYSAFFFYD
jgi:hypothetical protein